MASAEQQPSPALSRSARRGVVGKWLSLLAVVAVVCALIVLMLVRATVNGESAPAGVPAGWHTFHDQLGLLTVGVPPGWKVQDTVGLGPVVSNDSGSETFTQEGVILSDPSEGNGSAVVRIIVTPIETAFDRSWFCPERGQYFYSTFHGYPAQHMGGFWWFKTEKANFNIYLTIPSVEDGLGGPDTLIPSPTPTPIPITWLEADQADVTGILASLNPVDSKPLDC